MQIITGYLTSPYPQATMPHTNDTDTTQPGAQMDSPANTPYRRTIRQHRCRQHVLHAAHSGVVV